MSLRNDPRRARRILQRRVLPAALASAVLLGGVLLGAPSALAASGSSQTATTITSSGSGAIKHVWLIILENKSYDATFTGLNQNSYLWKTLPSQGVELTNYYGTGHSSMDNYLSMVSGLSLIHI